MQACKTCKWWGRDWRGCCGFVDTIQSGPTKVEVYAHAADDHNLEARLQTGPEFGCIHHAPKGEENASTSYRTFKRSARNFEEFVRARKITERRGLSYDQAIADCAEFNDNRTAAQIRRGTKLEFERE